MKLCLPILIATCYMTSTSAWSTGGPRLFVGPSPAAQMLFDSMNADNMMMRQRQRKRDYFNAMTRVSPRYEIKDSEKEIQISLDVPGVKAEDIHVTIEDGDSVLSIQGQRESSDGTSTTTRRFSQSFSLDPAVDLDKFTAHLNNGVLLITAPKDLQRLEKNLRRIPVMTAAASTQEHVTAEHSVEGADMAEKAVLDEKPHVENNDEAATIDLDQAPDTPEGSSKA